MKTNLGPLEGMIKPLRQHPGLAQFFIRGILLVAFLIGLQFLSLPFVDGIIVPEEFFTIQYIALGGMLMFSVVVFMMLAKDHLGRFPRKPFSWPSLIIFGILGLAFHLAFFYTKYWISIHPLAALQMELPIIIARYLLLILSVVSFGIAFLGLSYTIAFARAFKKEFLGTGAFFAVFTTFSYLVQNSWQLLSFIITRMEYFLMQVFFDNVKLYDSETLGVGNFIVNIGKVCSGIESIMLFTALYALVFFLDRKTLRSDRMALLFIPGLIGVLLVNTLRIFLILIIGILWSPQLAVGIFHTNLGWVLFIVYFFIFWYFAYPLVQKHAH